MKIAQIAPLTESVPPKFYGGTERVVSYLTEALIDLGHEVTLFASGDSRTRAKLVPAWPSALRFTEGLRDHVAPHIRMMELVRRCADQFDVLHFHLDYYPFSLFLRQSTPFVTTLHGRLDLPEHQSVFDTFNTVPVISTSQLQRYPLPQANWRATIYHGIPENLYRLQSAKPEYLAFLGRISPEKPLDMAIRIAVSSKLPLKIAAKIDFADRSYFNHQILPLLNQPNIEFIGEIDDDRKQDFLSRAHALLFPIDWPEPFGIAMLEAMACGTPVITFNRGSAIEIIDHGVSGLIVEDEIGALAAVKRLPTLARQKVRARFEERFTSRRMAQQYVETYQAMIHAQRRARFRLV